MAKKQIEPVDTVEELFAKVEELIIDAIKEEPQPELPDHPEEGETVKIHPPKMYLHPLERKVLAFAGTYDANRIAAMLMIDSDIVKNIIRDAGK